MLKRFRRRLKSERGSVYLEYALVASVTVGLALMLLDPGKSRLFTGVGIDYETHEVFMKLPIF